jgi:hypothetical protein
MPPSLRQAQADRGQAIIHVAVELQHKGDPSSHAISIEWHRSFVKLIQDGGLYRCLSGDEKWKLFGIGQELAVFGEIAAMLQKHKQQDLNWSPSLQSHDLAKWLLEIFNNEEERGWPNSNIWYDILSVSLDTALTFRDEYLETMYDIVSEEMPEPLWLSHPFMREMLRRQLSHWRAAPESVPSLPVIELVAKTAMLSCSEGISASESRKEEFAKIQRSAINVLRMVNGGDDELAFDLCIQYEYFEGLCEISVAHERKRDGHKYTLDPLFNRMQGSDLLNGMTFSQFVLQWHTDRGLFGHVINYGRHSIPDLNLIMDRNHRLRQYRWIPALRQKYYGKATDFFLENCQENKELKTTKWALSMAKLANKLVPSQNQQVHERQLNIEKTLELVNAQQMLLGAEVVEKKDEILLPANELIELAVNKLVETYDMQARVRLAMVALAVCASLDDYNLAHEYTTRIWAECLLSNLATWSEWTRECSSDGDLPLVRDEALTNTVFGILLEECRKDPNMRKVCYGRNIENAVIDRVIGDDNRESFTRILRAAADPSEPVQAESLMVSSF